MKTVIAILLLSASAASGAAVEVRARLEPPVIPFHHDAQLSIIVDAPGDMPVLLPQLGNNIGEATVSPMRRNTERLRGGRVRITETYTISPIFQGKYPVGPLTVLWGENEQTTVAGPVLVARDLTEAERAAVDEFADNAGPARQPALVVTHRKPILLTTLVMAALAAVAVWALRLREREQQTVPPPPPWEVAYARLRELDRRGLPQAGRHEPYYVDLTAILRYYIEDRFHLRAPEQTTEEFLAASPESGLFSNEQQQMLANLLKHSDRVKFAQHVPSAAEMDRSFAAVLQFIDETVPATQPDEQEVGEAAA